MRRAINAWQVIWQQRRVAENRKCLYRQADKSAQLDEHSSYAAIEALEHHWDKLSVKRKEQFAEMAALTRFVTSLCSETPHLYITKKCDG